MPLGIISKQTVRLLDYVEVKCAAKDEDSKISAKFKAATISATGTLHFLAQQIEKAVNFVIGKVKSCGTSLKDKAVEAKNFVSAKAQAAYNKVKSIGASKVETPAEPDAQATA